MRHSTLFYHHQNFKFALHKSRAYTFAIEPIFKNGDTNQLSHLLVGVARCSKKDTFNKKVGRKVALAKDPCLISLKELPQFIANYINEDLPVDYQIKDVTSQKFCWLIRKFL